MMSAVAITGLLSKGTNLLSFLAIPVIKTLNDVPREGKKRHWNCSLCPWKRTTSQVISTFNLGLVINSPKRRRSGKTFEWTVSDQNDLCHFHILFIIHGVLVSLLNDMKGSHIRFLDHKWPLMFKYVTRSDKRVTKCWFAHSGERNKSKTDGMQAFKKTNQNTQEVKHEPFLISTRQHNVSIFGIRCL